MDSSEIGTLILEAGISGNLAKLEAIKSRVDDEREFRRICDVYSDFCCRVQMSNSRRFTSLHYAVLKDNMELMNFLVLSGAPVEADSVDGTPLQCAASRGNVEAVEYQLHHGAGPNSISSVFGSPLICAIKSHSLECMELLFEAMADTNNLSPLSHAAKEGDTRFLNSLLDAGADPNLPRSSTGLMKPIEVAALAHNLEGVGILFPKTRKIPHYPNWSVDGIMEHCHSQEAKTKREEIRSRRLDQLDKAGKSAVSREDYFIAIKWYSEATFATHIIFLA